MSGKEKSTKMETSKIREQETRRGGTFDHDELGRRGIAGEWEKTSRSMSRRLARTTRGSDRSGRDYDGEGDRDETVRAAGEGRNEAEEVAGKAGRTT